MEPEGRNDRNVAELEGLLESLVATLAPDKMRDVLAHASTDLPSVIHHCVAEEAVSQLSIGVDFQEEDQALEKLRILLHLHRLESMSKHTCLLECRRLLALLIFSHFHF